ncbi:hypothetical protein [Halorhabdus amylolytica]|uniref:hypothetical protein n=1 Tax=Halorhabdus amylolytica TaxID=2559573 RepID=UPI0010AA7EBA|nr:hypothetical protein [Halorhabdus amylolytica]
MCRTYHIRVAALAERARRARSSFLPPEESPDHDRALEYLRDGVGPAVALYREAAIAGAEEALSPAESRRLDRALSDWLELYAACYGVHLDVEASAATAATLLGNGLTLRETARRLTGVPSGTGDGGRTRSNDGIVARTTSEHS